MKSIRSVHSEVGNYVEALSIMGKKSGEITLESDVIPSGGKFVQCSELADHSINLAIFQDTLVSKYLGGGGQPPL